MKLNTRGSEVEIIGAETEEQVFKIATSAIAFRTLSSNMYADPMKAVIRELACNAYDAHVEVGKGRKPFDLFLPTHLSPEFVIRDYGPGMSDEQVMELYCTYFASSKQGTNRQIGGFGIGSKSPFSYTDSFTVVSRQRGEKRTYSAFVNEMQMPAVVRLSTENVDEEDGLEVRFPVNSKDIYAFEEKARSVLEFFDPLPNINRTDFRPKKQQYRAEGKKWKMREHTGFDGIRVIQGKVPYSVSGMESVSSEKVQAVLGMPLDIFLPIGTLAVAANREALTSEKAVVQKLQVIFEEIFDELHSSIEKEVADLPTGWQKIVFIRSKIQHYGRGSSLAKIYEYQQKQVLSDTNLFGDRVIQAKDFPNLLVRRYRQTWSGWKSAEVLNGRLAYDRANLTDEAFMPSSEESIKFVVVDRSFGGDRQIRAWGESQSKVSSVIAIFPAHPQQNAKKFDMPGYLAEMVKLFTALGSPKWELLSTLPIPQKERVSQENAGPTYRSWVWSYGHNGSGFSGSWKSMEEPRPKQGTHFYVRTDRGKPIGFSPNCNALQFEEFLKAVRGLPFVEFDEDTSLHNFSEKERLPQRTEATWLNLIDHVLEKIDIYLADPSNLVTKYISTEDLSEFFCPVMPKQTMLSLPQSSLYRQAWDIYSGNLDKDKRQILDQILDFLRYLPDRAKFDEVLGKIPKDKGTVKELRTKLRAQYKLLAGKSVGYFDADLALYYVKAVDRQIDAEKTVDEGSRALGLD